MVSDLHGRHWRQGVDTDLGRACRVQSAAFLATYIVFLLCNLLLSSTFICHSKQNSTHWRKCVTYIEEGHPRYIEVEEKVVIGRFVHVYGGTLET